MYGMDKTATEEVMGKLYMFKSRFGKNGQTWLVGFRNNLIMFRYAIYLHIFQGLIPNPWCSFDVSRSRKLVNEQTGQSDMENVTYNFTLTYGTCKSFGSLYSFRINVYDRSYFSSTTNQRPDKRRW